MAIRFGGPAEPVVAIEDVDAGGAPARLYRPSRRRARRVRLDPRRRLDSGRSRLLRGVRLRARQPRRLRGAVGRLPARSGAHLPSGDRGRLGRHEVGLRPLRAGRGRRRQLRREPRRGRRAARARRRHRARASAARVSNAGSRARLARTSSGSSSATGSSPAGRRTAPPRATASGGRGSATSETRRCCARPTWRRRAPPR